MSRFTAISQVPASEHTDSEDEYNWEMAAEEAAAKRGQVVVRPLPNQLQLDLDSRLLKNEALDRMDAFDILHSWALIESSKTEGHFHITITFPDRVFTEPERIAYQFALGSDPVRERLNLMRFHHGCPDPSRLFKTPPPPPQ